MATAVSRRTGFHSLRVAEVERLCDDAVAVTFEVPPSLAETFAFAPGQSLTLRRSVDGRDERRSYSICAQAGSRPRVGVRLVPEGVFSSWLVNEVRAGDEVEVAAPTGSFTPDLTTGGHHVLIAAGSGITPVLSIASSLLATPDATVTVLYGNRRTDTVMFADELADLKDRWPSRLELVHVLSREPREAELFTGRLDVDKLRALFDSLVPVDEADHFWLCGPFGMVTGAQELLSSLGVPAERVHQELFYVDDVPPEPVKHVDAAVVGASSEVTLVLDGRSTTMSLPRESSVLDGAQRFRPDLPFACKGGVCGTCRARVTEGSVEMRRNFALEKSEVDAGFVLTCQSHPVTDRVTVDYDA
ncbi:1,2-phenylacetyl-CoA epoxidase subunit PaaE [Amycolatopsis saalfeldensis]|uniref:3-ketosteroid-9-alpha-monooxygenase, ferredoxin reductase component n=1 Tax=Amycolatopsis saalfeldensis TaxID=394193 RepID=A0A1H8YDJ0_9PSEU|nr:1,2-phenylacetyl-CoA epoxidase subunit PaaE [Amycolatopsis saalfeldensis]SEP50304.1 ring-1,2-phenylacetyl-CoA epoxidase subunit PaaE [Amycolatopsis saalfeldensis]